MDIIIFIVILLLVLNLLRESNKTSRYRGSMGVNPFCTKVDGYKQCTDKRYQGLLGMRRGCVDLSVFNAHCPYRKEPERPSVRPVGQAPANNGGN